MRVRRARRGYGWRVTVATKADEAQRTARRAADSDWTDRLARLGFCARGLIYMIVGAIAFEIARSPKSGADEEASKEGALREIADRSFGRPLLVVLAIGLAGYALWRATEALWGRRDEDDEAKRLAKRAFSGFRAILYATFCVTTVRFATRPSSSGGGGDEQEESWTARALDWPLGQLIVGAVGAGLIGGGLWVAYRGLAQKFEKRLDTSDMGPTTGTVVDVLGTVGLAARGLVFSVAGFLFVKAAIDFNPEEATGVDGTLRTIADHAYGQVLLTATAAGLVAYGLYSFFEARYRQL